MDYKPPNLRHLRAFREVAVCKSISEASRHIYLSQPAITQAIAKIETQLQVSLFERRRAGMFLTEAGELFLKRVDRALELILSGAMEAVSLGTRKEARAYNNFDRRITTVQLKALIAVADAGNFSLAARTLGITQPSLHRAARDLERLSEITLFIKARHGIEMSRAAIPMIQHTKLAFSELAQAFDEIAEWRGLDTSEIVIGSMPLARAYVLPTAINKHTRKYPEARIRVVDAPYDDLLHSLRHGEVDFLIGALRNPLPVDDVVQEPLFSESLTMAVRPAHPLMKQSKIVPEDLRRFPWVVPRKQTPTRIFFDSLFSDQSVPYPDKIIETSSFILMRSLLMDSNRIGLVSTHQIILEEQLGLLCTLPFQMDQTKRPIGLTFRRDWRPTATQEEFLSIVRSTGKAVQAM